MSDERDPGSVTKAAALAAFFEPDEVKWKAQAVKNNRALACAYIDARLVEERLDEVVGCENWSDAYDVLSDGSVTCRLAVRFGGEWVTKTDVGSPSEQPDGGDRMKAAFSDALKRAAVKFGIGRYLYRLPSVWVEYDPARKQLAERPQLPAWACPRGRQQQPPAQQQARPQGQQPQGQPAPQQQAAQQQPKADKPAAGAMPATGAEFRQRINAYDPRLAAELGTARGALIAYVFRRGKEAGFPAEIAQWNADQIKAGVEFVKEFDRNARQPQKAGA